MITAYRRQEAESEPVTLDLANASPQKGPKPFFNRWRLGFLFVLILSIVAYLPSLIGTKIWDDDALLDGSGIGGGTSILGALTKPFLGAYFRPLVSLSFYFENKIWNGVPFYYHQTNILLHAFTCAALVGLVLLAFGSRRLALLSGLLFAIQPLQVSAVAWIGGRTDDLCALLVVLFAYTLVLGVRAKGWARVLWFGASVLSFFLAAFTKEQVLGLLPLVPLGLKIFGREDHKCDFRTCVRLTSVYVLASAVFISLWFLYNPSPYHALVRGVGYQLLTAGQTTLYYSLLILMPSSKWMHTLSLGTMQALGWTSAVAGLFLLACYIVGTLACLKMNPKLGWFAALVGLAMAPVSNLVPLPSLLVAPYRAGVAGAGVAVILAYLILRYRKNVAVMVAAPAFVLWCAWLSWWGSAQWRDPVTIFDRITTEDPYSIVARRNMSMYQLRTGQAQGSIDQMKAILSMLYGSDDWKDSASAYRRFKNDPALAARVEENQGNEVKPEAWLGELFAQLGFAEAKIHDFGASRRAFQTALQIDPWNPRPRIGMAEFAIYDGNPEEASRQLRIAVGLHPSDAALYALLGHVYVQLHRSPLAIQAYQKSVSLEPWFGPTYRDLAEAQVKAGDITGAISTLKASLKCTVLDGSGVRDRIEELERLKEPGSHGT